MKRFLLFAGCLFLLAACTQDPTNESGGGSKSSTTVVVGPSQGAVEGTIAVKLSPEGAALVEQAKLSTRAGATRSGVEDLDRILEQIGAEHFERIIAYDADYEWVYDKTGLNRWYRVNFSESASLESVAELFSAAPGVKVVEFTHRPQALKRRPAVPMTEAMAKRLQAQTRATFPMNDQLLAAQWHYDNRGATTAYPERKEGADIDLFDAWNLCTGGEDIIVAVLDEPVQYSHPDLEANMWANPANPKEHGYNFYNGSATLDWKTKDSDGYYADHGSHVAGVIAAVNNNSIGVCGIAGGGLGRNGVKIMTCQMLGNSNKNVQNDADIKAFDYAMKNGAVIAQCSWGYPASMTEAEWNRSDGALRAAMDTFILGAGSNNKNFPNSPLAGGIITFAGGNDGVVYGDVKTWPSAYGPVIAVGAMGWDFKPAEYTNYGTWTDITAPGGDYTVNSEFADEATVFSTILCDNTMSFSDGRKSKPNYGYGYMEGTSMACPHVSGVAALGLAYASKIGKKYTPEEFTSLLLTSVYGIDQYFTGTKTGWISETKTKILNLPDYVGKMGSGCTDAFKLLLAVKGTPALTVNKGVDQTIDLAPYFGDANAKVKFTKVEISSSDLQKIGLATAPAVNGTKITVNCANMGSATMKVSVTAGDKPISREFVLVVRNGMAANGGWL